MTARFPILAFAAAIMLPAAAQAHPKLVSATPAADATVAAPAKVELRFSERLMPKLSGATLAMTGMGGKPHAPMAVSGVTSSVGPDGKSLVLKAAKPLAAGSYKVDWHVVSADTHRITGGHNFTVR